MVEDITFYAPHKLSAELALPLSRFLKSFSQKSVVRSLRFTVGSATHVQNETQT